MRERSHEKGSKYQRQVKTWLDKHLFLGYESEVFGDAYDVSCNATMIGGIGYDISMRLKRNDETIKILYVECKYRDEISGTIDSVFHEFLIIVKNLNFDTKRIPKKIGYPCMGETQ